MSFETATLQWAFLELQIMTTDVIKTVYNVMFEVQSAH